MKKKRPFVPVATPGTKGHPLLSRTGVPGQETGKTAVSQPGQINVFVVVGRTISTVAQCRTSYLSAISGRKSVSKPHTYFSERSWQDMPLEPGMQKNILEPRSQFCRWKFYTHSLLLPEMKDQSCNIWQVFPKNCVPCKFLALKKYFSSLLA